MVRSLLRFGAAVAFAALIAPPSSGAAPAPGLAYDEILRVVPGGTSQPPDGFAAEVTALADATPTPAPRRRPAAPTADVGLGAPFAEIAVAARAYLQPRL
ncbi:MAG TPA: hypothetical protein VGN14_04375, partial [Candidatus Elarobacter sp.]